MLLLTLILLFCSEKNILVPQVNIIMYAKTHSNFTVDAKKNLNSLLMCHLFVKMEIIS